MRLIDADALKRKAQKLSTEAWKTNRVVRVTHILNQFIDWIEGMSTIDAVEVVRCKDCKHYEFADNRAFGMPVKYCDWFGFEDVDDNDFCSRGERREESDTE